MPVSVRPERADKEPAESEAVTEPDVSSAISFTSVTVTVPGTVPLPVVKFTFTELSPLIELSDRIS